MNPSRPPRDRKGDGRERPWPRPPCTPEPPKRPPPPTPPGGGDRLWPDVLRKIFRKGER